MISIEDAETIRPEWAELSQRAVEPNPYYEPDHLIALCRYIRAEERHWLVLIRDRGTNQLEGLFPVTVKGLKDGFPGGVTEISFDSLVGQTVPLIGGQDPSAVWASFLDFVAAHEELPSIVHLREFYPESARGIALAEAVTNGMAAYQAESGFLRAVAAKGLSHDAYTARWSRKKARNLRSRTRKLSELGDIDLEIVEAGDLRFNKTLDEILALEVAGWKGRAGTALASNEQTKKFAHSAYGSTNNLPAIHLATLRLNGSLIAGDINLVSQRRAYFIKSAYDETYAKYGPGVILYDYSLQEMLDHDRYDRLDSCADAGHPLEEIWLEHEAVEGAFVAAADSLNSNAIKHLITARKSLLGARNLARAAWQVVGGNSRGQ